MVCVSVLVFAFIVWLRGLFLWKLAWFHPDAPLLPVVLGGAVLAAYIVVHLLQRIKSCLWVFSVRARSVSSLTLVPYWHRFPQLFVPHLFPLSFESKTFWPTFQFGPWSPLQLRFLLPACLHSLSEKQKRGWQLMVKLLIFNWKYSWKKTFIERC